MKKSIFSLLSGELQSDIFDKPFRLNQISDFIIKQKNFDFFKMTNLPKNIQKSLDDQFSIINIISKDKKVSEDGTVKFLFELEDGNCVESVILKDENDRCTFCISSQVGCKLNCSFCMTGKMGFFRNLSYTEIISQIMFLSRESGNSFNIVFMGMGEPLDNFENLTNAIRLLSSKKLFDFSQTRITVSTSGITEKIPELLNLFPKINLAVSINSFIQEKRETIMPVSKKFLLKDLIQTLYECYYKFRNRITLEFVLIKDFNDDLDEISELKKINKDPFLINIIPLNDNATNDLKKPEEAKIRFFCDEISKAGFNVTRRYRRGDDIQASCGLLFWENKNK